ncbi:hypothetical protein PR002_g26817 [Phytophthora rubi]|uniref:RxLR effector protein n=1 Tax=Phytophthora rubi TaxID=129364 RepID=A0A6A3HUP4_9STRA|nr:hypothetical protein PR002_g26817 [Phytophthora rubi]
MSVLVVVLVPITSCPSFLVQACASPFPAGGLTGWRPQRPPALCFPYSRSMGPDQPPCTW